MIKKIKSGLLLILTTAIIGYFASTYFLPGLWVKGGVLDILPSRFLTGNVEKFWFHSEITFDRRIWVYLPPDYDENDTAYPVIYIHDGQWAFDGRNGSTFGMEFSIDETLEQLISDDTIPPVIAIGIQSFVDGEQVRSNEFLPLPYQDGNFAVGGGAARYADMLSNELMPYVADKYRILQGPEHTATAGFGYGANLSFYLVMNHHDLFGAAIAHSPDTFYKQQWMTTAIKAIPEKLPFRLWADIGSAEFIDRLQLDFQFMAFTDAVQAKGWTMPHEFSYVVEPGGLHAETAVARRFPAAVQWLFQRDVEA